MTIEFKISAVLLEREVILQTDNSVPVCGLSYLNVSPQGKGLGRATLKEIEGLSNKDGKYAVVAFARDNVLDFYLKCGWYNCGKYMCKYGEKNIVSSVNLGPCTVKEDW